MNPDLSIKSGDNLVISNQMLLELMREVLAKGAVFQFRATGWSMTPFIKDGDAITIAPLMKERLSLGKVVAYIQPATGHLIVHRVIGRQGAAFLIQGDNATGRPDEWVLPQDILGCVLRVERQGRRVRLGLGLERYIIAILSRNGLLLTAMRRLWALKRFLLKISG
jgi:hypothetical protein